MKPTEADLARYDKAQDEERRCRYNLWDAQRAFSDARSEVFRVETELEEKYGRDWFETPTEGRGPCKTFYVGSNKRIERDTPCGHCGKGLGAHGIAATWPTEGRGGNKQ